MPEGAYASMQRQINIRSNEAYEQRVRAMRAESLMSQARHEFGRRASLHALPRSLASGEGCRLLAPLPLLESEFDFCNARKLRKRDGRGILMDMNTYMLAIGQGAPRSAYDSGNKAYWFGEVAGATDAD